MLTLTRRTGETVVLQVEGQEIRVTLSEIKSSNQARLSFDAAPEVSILREEIADT